MASERSIQPGRFNWTLAANIAGIVLILVTAVLLYNVIRDTDDLSRDPLEDSIPQLTPEQARDRLAQNREIILLDVRTPNEWNQVPHAEGATSMPLNELDERAFSELDKDAEIIVMCYSGNVRSMKAAVWFRENGYTNVYNLDGGVSAWTAAQLPTDDAIKEDG